MSNTYEEEKPEVETEDEGQEVFLESDDSEEKAAVSEKEPEPALVMKS